MARTTVPISSAGGELFVMVARSWRGSVPAGKVKVASYQKSFLPKKWRESPVMAIDVLADGPSSSHKPCRRCNSESIGGGVELQVCKRRIRHGKNKDAILKLIDILGFFI